MSSTDRRHLRRLTAPLAVLVLAAACNTPESTSPAPSAGAVSAAELEAQGVPHTEPRIFEPGVISTDREEYHITFTPDGNTAYWSVSDEFFPISKQATIVWSSRTGGEWSAPQVASFSGVYSDIDPFITPDGSRLFFSSVRPVDGQERTDADLWVVEREGSGWGEPQHLGALVNSPTDELYASVDREGVLYFASERAGGYGGWDIYRSTPTDGGYGAPENLGAAINGELWEFNPWITPDGRTLIFTGLNQPDGYGLGDLYASVLKNGEWQPRKNLGDRINSPLDDYHPSLSPDGKTLFFVRHSYEPWIPGDIYYAPVRALRGWVLNPSAP